MSNFHPKITIVIPTKNRLDTLKHSIETCILQDYDNLFILISDNNSQDGTKEYVSSLTDRRIRYVNTGKPVCMTENWEFALSTLDDFAGYVTYLGDDDGLLPDSIKNLVEIIEKTKAKAIAWRKAEYHWPNHPNKSLQNIIKIPASNILLKIDSTTALKHSINYWLPYNRLPTLYNSIVCLGVIKKLTSNKTFFKSVTPDVYSGFALLRGLDYYLYSTRPFSINGASSSSNGATMINGNCLSGAALSFMSDNDLNQSDIIQVIPGAIYSNIAEAILQANKYCYENSLNLNKKLTVNLILRDIHRYLPNMRQKSLSELFAMANKLGVEDYAQKISKKIEKKINHSIGINDVKLIELGEISFSGEKFNIQNIHNAADFVHNKLSSYVVPAITKYSLLTLILSRRLRDFSIINFLLKIKCFL